MTLKQFLEKLSLTPRTWLVCEPLGVLRCNDMDTEDIAYAFHCPISRVAQVMVGMNDGAMMAEVLGHELGLAPLDIIRIMRAADGRGSVVLRRQLLEACGLVKGDADA